MNTKKTRNLALFMALLLLGGSMLVGCQKASNADANEKEGSASVTTAETVPETEPDPLAGLDFGGETIRIYTSLNAEDPDGIGNSNYLIQGPEEESGDVVDDAVYKRNRDVEELLNVKLKFTGVDFDYTKIGPDVSKMVLAGDDVYDLIVNDLFPMAALSIEGMFMNVLDSKYFDFEQPYWWYDYMKDLTIGNDKMFILAGDFFIDILRTAHSLYFNKTLMENMFPDESPDAIYQLVLDGKWTVDAFMKYVKDGYRDLNGDGKAGKEDQFGYSTVGMWGPMIPFVISSDIDFITRDNEGIPSITMNNERSVKCLERLNDIFYSQGTYTKYEVKDLVPTFSNGTALFVGYQRLGCLEKFRGMKDEVGILPYPKLDETQPQYITSSHDTSEIGVIPVTCPRFETVCAVVEALCRETSKTLLPAYYETALKVKYARDDTSAQMIDLIHDNIRDTFPLAYSNMMNDIFLNKTFSVPLAKNSTDFASAYAKAEPTALKKLENMVTTFMEKTA